VKIPSLVKPTPGFPSGAGTRAGVSGAFGLTSEPRQGPAGTPGTPPKW